MKARPTCACVLVDRWVGECARACACESESRGGRRNARFAAETYHPGKHEQRPFVQAPWPEQGGRPGQVTASDNVPPPLLRTPKPRRSATAADTAGASVGYSVSVQTGAEVSSGVGSKVGSTVGDRVGIAEGLNVGTSELGATSDGGNDGCSVL